MDLTPFARAYRRRTELESALRKGGIRAEEYRELMEIRMVIENFRVANGVDVDRLARSLPKTLDVIG